MPNPNFTASIVPVVWRNTCKSFWWRLVVGNNTEETDAHVSTRDIFRSGLGAQSVGLGVVACRKFNLIVTSSTSPTTSATFLSCGLQQGTFQSGWMLARLPLMLRFKDTDEFLPSVWKGYMGAFSSGNAMFMSQDPCAFAAV
eukprot:2943750-Amphidinium_carterae.1